MGARKRPSGPGCQGFRLSDEMLVKTGGLAGFGRIDERGPAAFAAVAQQVNWETTSISPPVSSSERSACPLRLRKPADGRSCLPDSPPPFRHRPGHPSRTSSPRPMRLISSPSTRTDASLTRWTTARISFSCWQELLLYNRWLGKSSRWRSRGRARMPRQRSAGHEVVSNIN